MITTPVIKNKTFGLGNVAVANIATAAGLTTGTIATTTDLSLVTCDTRSKFVKLPSALSFGIGRTLRIRVALPGTDVSCLILGNANTDLINGVAIGAGGYNLPVTQMYYLTAISATEWELQKEDLEFATKAVGATSTADGLLAGLISALGTVCRVVSSGNAAHFVTLPYASDYGVGRRIKVSINGTGCHIAPRSGDTINAATIVDVTLAATRSLEFVASSATTWSQVDTIATILVA